MRAKFICVLAMIGFLVALTGCVSSRPYQTDLGPRVTLTQPLPAPIEPVVTKDCPPATSTACTVFVEYDDYGNPMNRAQLLGAIEAAKETAFASGTILVYVHGWHHSADNTEDVLEFKDLVARGAKLDTSFREGRPGSGNILGIYVAWRGDSIDSRGVTMPLSYALTFWDRKSASHDIGNSGGVYELFSRLAEVRRNHKDSRLLIHGHSMGGAVVYSTVVHTLMDQIRMDAVGVTASAPPVADLVVLVNPAIEAMKFRPQLDLARTQEYKPNLPPRLVILTTQEDWATGVVFRAGRIVGTPIDAYADEHSPRQNTTAIGHYIPYVTHQLAEPKDGECGLRPALDSSFGPGDISMVMRPAATLWERLPRLPIPKFLLPRAAAGTPVPIAQVPPVQSLESVLDATRPSLCFDSVLEDSTPLLLHRCDQPGNCSEVAGDTHHVPRGRVMDGLVPYRLPIMNIRATSAVSTGHNDIRNPDIENFIVQLMALAVRDPNSAAVGRNFLEIPRVHGPPLRSPRVKIPKPLRW